MLLDKILGENGIDFMRNNLRNDTKRKNRASKKGFKKDAQDLTFNFFEVAFLGLSSIPIAGPIAAAFAAAVGATSANYDQLHSSSHYPILQNRHKLKTIIAQNLRIGRNEKIVSILTNLILKEHKAKSLTSLDQNLIIEKLTYGFHF